MFFSRRKNDDLSEKLVKLVVPIAIQQFMLALVSATDAVMLGFVDLVVCSFTCRTDTVCA